MEDTTRGNESETGMGGGEAEKPKRRRRRTKEQMRLDAEQSGDAPVSDVGEPAGAEPTIDGPGSDGDSGGSPGIDTGESSATDRGKPKRGRKPGAGKKAPKIDRVNALGNVLSLIHGATANMLGIPEIMLSQQETSLLSEALVDCADAWGFNPVSDPRIVTSVVLGGLIVAIYGPRVKGVKNTLAQRKQQGQQVATHEHNP
jgi:hypothetical protein